MNSLVPGWQHMPLGKVGRWYGGGTPSKANPEFWANGNIPWVTPKDMKSERITDTQDHITKDAILKSATNLVAPGSVLVVVRSGILRHTLPVAIVDREVTLNQDLKAVLPIGGLDSKYLALALKAFEKEILHSCVKNGTTVQNLSHPLFLRFSIPVAPSNMQKKIVAEIEKQFARLEAGVAALKRVKANLKRYRAAVLKTACEGKLVPTEAELAKKSGRKYETGAELLKRILVERRQKWTGRGKYKEPIAPDISNLPKLPEGWTWATVEQIGDVKLGRQRSPAHHRGQYMRPYLRVANVYEDHIDLSDVKEMNFTPNEYEQFHLKPNDILLNEGQSLELIGRPALYSGELPGACFQNTLVRFRTNDAATPRFALVTFRAFMHNGRFQKIAKWTTNIAHLGADRFAKLSFPLPPIAEQKRIADEVARRLNVIEEQAQLVEASLVRAQRLRQSILQKAFSGELVIHEKVVSEKTSVVIQSSEVSTKPTAAKPSEKQRRHFMRAVLAAEIVDKLHNEPTFGRVKHQKVFQLCEYMAQLEEIQGDYHREAAGPYDNTLMYTNENELKRQKWYEPYIRNVTSEFGHAYRPLGKAGTHKKYLSMFSQDKLSVIGKIIELMRIWGTDRCEIFSTVYMAWNDLIILRQEPTEDTILHEVLDCWNPSKRRFPKTRWRNAIRWMKKEGYVPSGFGRLTIRPGV